MTRQWRLLMINFAAEMLPKPINSTLKGKVNKLIELATQKAENAFQENILSKIENLETFESFKVHYIEMERLKKIQEEHTHPFYIYNHSSPEWLLTQFASRTFLLSIDESEILVDAIYIGTYLSLVRESVVKYKDIIPDQTFENFINGVENKYFSEFDNQVNTPEKDYYKIKEWQSTNLIKIVSYEYQMLIKQIQEHCKTLKDPLAFIADQHTIYEEKINKSPANAKAIKKALSEFFIFKNVSLAEFDDSLLLENFLSFKDEQINWKKISPNTIAPLLNLLEFSPAHLFSNEFTIFYTLNKIDYWFEIIIKGAPIQQKVGEPNYEKLLAEAQKEAEAQANKAIDVIENFVSNKNNTKEAKKEFLINQFELYRSKFNSFEKKYLFHLFRDEQKHLINNMFLTNCFFGNDTEETVKAIIESTIIQEVSWNIMVNYDEIFGTRKIDFTDKTDSYTDVMFLLHQMVLDKEIHNELRDSMDAFFEHFHNYFLPIEMHFQSHKENLSSLFHKAIDRLEEILDDAEPTNKILFLQSRLKETKHREAKLNQFKNHKDYGDTDFKYSTLFKEFLSIEADFIKETANLPNLLAIEKPNQMLMLESKIETFATILSEEKQVFILELLEDIGVTVNGKAVISGRKKSAIRGIVEALKENGILPNKSLEVLNKIIATAIGLELKSKLDFTDTSKTYQQKANKYISDNYLK